MASVTSLITEENRPYWEALKQHELRFQKCSGCGHIRFPVRWICPQCLGEQFTWDKMSGLGTVESFIWYFERPAAIPDFSLEAPYNVAAVRLDEGVVLLSNVLNVAFGELVVGDRVKATFDALPDGWNILRFLPDQVAGGNNR